MKILHITPHMGGGVGTVIRGWIDHDKFNRHSIICLDYVNEISLNWANSKCIDITGNPGRRFIDFVVKRSDIVVVHWWPHKLLDNLFSEFGFSPVRMIFWCHYNYNVHPEVVKYPDMFISTSKVMGGQYDCIMSTGGVDEFLKVKHEPTGHFNVGYVGTVDWKKLHGSFLLMMHKIGVNVTESIFTIVGEDNISKRIQLPWTLHSIDRFRFVGKVDDIYKYYSGFDVFGYPLRHDHYGTAEQVLGEAMACGIVPVCMDNPAEKLIIQEGITGYLCKSEEEYIDNIEHLYHKPTLRKWMGQNARESAAAMYDIRNMVGRWNATFEEIMEQPKTSRGALTYGLSG